LSKGFRDRGQQRVKGFLMFQNAEDDVEEFAHEGATNGEVMEFAILQTGNPRLEGLRPTPSNAVAIARRQASNDSHKKGQEESARVSVPKGQQDSARV
jgi:hypothetical protein